MRRPSGRPLAELLEPRRMLDANSGLVASDIWADRNLPEVVADLTNDGRTDLVLTRQNSGRTTGLFLRRGLDADEKTGSPRFGQAQRLLSAQECRGLRFGLAAAGRFTSGNDLDIVLQRERPNGMIELLFLLNQGDGSFRLASVTPLSEAIGRMTPASLAGSQARQSLVVLNGQALALQAMKFTDNGRPLLTRTLATGRDLWLFSTVIFDYAPQVADADGDGFDDVLLTRSDGFGETVQLILSRNGGRRFESRVVASVGTDNVFSQATLADFSGDGVPDLIYTVSNYRLPGAEAFGSVQVRHGVRSEQGWEGFGPQVEVYRRQDPGFDVEFRLAIQAVGDATGDGRPDIIIETLYDDGGDVFGLDLEAIQYPQDPQNPPAPVHLIEVGDAHTPWWINVVFKVADVDGDGVLDVFRRDDRLELWKMP